ncbi:MAG: DUF6152 family protein [Gammaproteobacteria bacterium]|nr:DUF6152 family protein [Gammaproteobacteria bacterium]MDP2140549.1 DUF6152 family protein [Gammaproteobacteria bacterium]MDP2347318.1 DUF6152 family protein [Gammaproteobacteria bacterium]
MRLNRWIAAAIAATVTGFTIVVTPVIAHHASGPFYDPDRRVEIEGSVTRFVFRNPHAFLYVNVTDAAGAISEWQIELGAPVSLSRTGWTPETLPLGMIVKVSGQPSRAEGSQGMCCVRMTRQDGSPVLSGGRVEEAVQPPR